jgi:predicted secreted Zn-dependent protease
MTTAWVPQREAVRVFDEGDILTPLRGMYDRYVQKSMELYDKAVENYDKREDIIRAANFYRETAEAIQGLLDQ